MAANAPRPLHTARFDVRHRGTHEQPDLLDWLNRMIDRLFCFELEADELLCLASPGKGVKSARATLSG